MSRLAGRQIVVPGSIGNLGPGFDTVGLAVGLYLRLRVRDVVDDGRGRLTCRFVDGDGRPRGVNRIQRAFALGASRRRTPSLTVDVSSEIPQRAGLGSSAAATIAGLRLRALVSGVRDPHELLADAYKLERHPDNAAAALFGGLSSSCVLPDGRIDVQVWRWPSRWRIIVATPETPLSTRRSRDILPERIPLADVVFNIQRVARLLAAVRDQDEGALRDALADRCHQPYRQRVVPQLCEALDLRHPDILGVCLSGAGPSVAAVAARNFAGVSRALAAVYRRAGMPCVVRTLTVHQEKRS